MCIVKLKEGVYFVGALDWDRRLFDELIPLPDGTSYNSYLIEGDKKIALIDTVDPSKKEILIQNLEEMGIERLDYIIANHAEQDHSGSIPEILELYPEAKVVTNFKCRDFLIELLHVSKEKFITVMDGENISLGNKTLEFIIAPWVHWPETMFTYLKEDKILFTCDFLGSHLATTKLFAGNDAKVYEAAKRYYAEIMMPFRPFIKKHLKKIEEMDVQIIAPSHGPVYDIPDFILTAYKEWISNKVENEVIIPFVSMHGSTASVVEYLTSALVKRGINVKIFNLSVTDIGELAMALVDAPTIVIASPTVLGGPHPLALYIAYLVRIFKPKVRFVGIVGSYGWGGRIVDQLKEIVSNLNVELLQPVLIKGLPKKEDYRTLDALADEIAEKHEKLFS